MSAENHTIFRVCTKCQQKLPETEEYFYRRSEGRQKFRSTCRDCTKSPEQREKDRLRAAARRTADPEHAKAIGRRCYANNKEKNRANARAYQQKHRAHSRARVNAWRRKYPERVRASVRASDNRRYYRDVEKAREKARINVLKRDTRKRQLPHLWNKDIWEWCLEYWAHTCAYCGRHEDIVMILSMEHVVPFCSEDCPGTVPWNMVPACHGRTGCNMRKNRKPVHQWLESTFGSEVAGQRMQALEEYFAVAKARYDA